MSKKKKDEESILIEIEPWFWSLLTEEEREDHRRMNPFFTPRVVRIAKAKEVGPKAKG